MLGLWIGSQQHRDASKAGKLQEGFSCQAFTESWWRGVWWWYWCWSSPIKSLFHIGFALVIAFFLHLGDRIMSNRLFCNNRLWIYFSTAQLNNLKKSLKLIQQQEIEDQLAMDLTSSTDKLATSKKTKYRGVWVFSWIFFDSTSWVGMLLLLIASNLTV